jgi:hypothetical protein
MRLAIYERLYDFNFHLIEARRTLEELALALKIDEGEEFRRIQTELDEARREANRRCCGQIEHSEARENDGHSPREHDPNEVVVHESRNASWQSSTRNRKDSGTTAIRSPNPDSSAAPDPDEDDPVSELELPVRPATYSPSSGANFTEAAGKTVAFINYVDEDGDGDYQCLEVRFTDGTLFSFDLVPRVRLRALYMESRRGDLDTIRDYGYVAENALEADRP